MSDDRTKLMEARTFEVGDVLGRSFAIWGKNFVPFGLITLIVHAPLFLLHLMTPGMSPGVAVAYGSVIGILSGALAMVATGAVTYGVVMQMRQQPVSMMQAVKVGLSRMLSVIGVAVVIALMIIVPIVLLVFISPAIAVVVGFVLVIFVNLVYWVAVPAAVVERLGVGDSLSRSAKLTSGSRGTIFLLWLIIGVIAFAFTFALGALLMSLPDLARLIVSTAIQAFVVSSLGAVVNAVGYQALRTSKEGVSLEDIAKVFD
jgi:hypothetical protein